MQSYIQFLLLPSGSYRILEIGNSTRRVQRHSSLDRASERTARATRCSAVVALAMDTSEDSFDVVVEDHRPERAVVRSVAVSADLSYDDFLRKLNKVFKGSSKMILVCNGREVKSTSFSKSSPCPMAPHTARSDSAAFSLLLGISLMGMSQV